VGQSISRFRIVHPFHPLRGTEYELVLQRTNWGEDRVFFYGPDGALKSFPANLTNVVPLDDFARVSAGRSPFRMDDLLELHQLLDAHKKKREGRKDV
jgi:hypothetical protein